jgi:FKBP-type peptidyl-prolyl cis-trans isomerase 2
MTTAKAGDTVQIHYTGKLDSGEQFDSSMGGEPLEFTLGGGQVIAGFDKGVSGMSVGEKKTIRVLPKDAYGDYDDDLVIQVSREDLPALNYELGTELVMQQPSGRGIPVIVIDANDEAVVLDANHPLAGEALTFELELVGIR